MLRPEVPQHVIQLHLCIRDMPLLLSPRTSLVLAVTLGSLTLYGCTGSRGHALPSSDLPTPPSRSASACSSDLGKNAFDSFVSDLSAGHGGLVSEYFASEVAFQRWWDPTVPSGTVVAYRGLGRHLAELQRDGLHLSVTQFRDFGLQAGPHPSRWFNFRLRGHLDSDGINRNWSGKGGASCQSGKLIAVVLG